MIKLTHHQLKTCCYMNSLILRCQQHTKAATTSTAINTKSRSKDDHEEPPVIVFDKDDTKPIKSDKETFPTKLESQQTAFEKFIQKFRKPSKSRTAPPDKLEKQGASVIFSDEEPLQLNPSMIKLNTKDRSLWHWQDGKIDLKTLPNYYLMLSKSRLSMLVCITSAAGYGLASTIAVDPLILAVSTLGVGLTSASANSINQILEVPFDSQMNRTQNRVLVKGLLTPWHAFGFALATGTSGAVLLWHCVNPVASMIAMTNLFLYTSVYTPMKRLSIYNTWVGSIVGALPPIIGWVSATGTLDIGALVLGGILYTWQFPHFNSLSWNLRPDYSRAGYRMMSVTDPDLCKRVALR